MGTNAQLVCFDCDTEIDLGRAYNYNKEAINEKLEKSTYEMLKLAVTRFNHTLKQIDMFGDDYTFDHFIDILEFLKEHKDHKLWLVDDYFDRKQKISK